MKEKNYLIWIKKILERYTVIEDSFLDYFSDEDKKYIELIPKVYNLCSKDIFINKTECGEYFIFCIDNRRYRMGKYIKDNKETYFICHDIFISERKTRVQIKDQQVIETNKVMVR